MNIATLTIRKASDLLAKKEITSKELTLAVLKEIDRKEQKINAYITLEGDLAIEQAKKCDTRILKGEKLGDLDGIPLAIKDNIMVKGLPCTAGSKILEDFIAPYDATVVTKIKEAGAVIIGKTNMDEFAMGSSTEASYFGRTSNPNNLERVPGGSSGGSAAAVASDMCLGALGSDTGGSIRQPASFCGIVGLKPSYGQVSRYGLLAMASSLDQIGPITKTVEDSMILFNVIKGNNDARDSTSVDFKKDNLIDNVQNLKIGVINTKPTDNSLEIYLQVLNKIQNHFKNTQKIEELEDILDLSLACYYIIMPAEVSSNLARYDGIKYGYSILKQEYRGNLLDVYLKSRAEGFGEEAKRRIILGTYVLSAGYYDAYYKSAQKARVQIKEDFKKIFQKYDLIILPTSPTLPFKAGEKINDPLAMYLSDIYTVPINIAGHPAISIPIGKVGNLPVGLQIIGPAGGENKILKAANFIENILRAKK